MATPAPAPSALLAYALAQLQQYPARFKIDAQREAPAVVGSIPTYLGLRRAKKEIRRVIAERFPLRLVRAFEPGAARRRDIVNDPDYRHRRDLVMSGTLREASRATGIPLTTLHRLRKRIAQWQTEDAAQATATREESRPQLVSIPKTPAKPGRTKMKKCPHGVYKSCQQCHPPAVLTAQQLAELKAAEKTARIPKPRKPLPVAKLRTPKKITIYHETFGWGKKLRQRVTDNGKEVVDIEFTDGVRRTLLLESVIFKKRNTV